MFNVICILKISFISGLEGQHQGAGAVFQVGEKFEAKGLYMSYKLWRFSKLVSLLHENFLFTSCKESCTGQVIIKQFAFIIGFKVLTAVSSLTAFSSLCYDSEDHTLQFVFIVLTKIIISILWSCLVTILVKCGTGYFSSWSKHVQSLTKNFFFPKIKSVPELLFSSV